MEPSCSAASGCCRHAKLDNGCQSGGREKSEGWDSAWWRSSTEKKSTDPSRSAARAPTGVSSRALRVSPAQSVVRQCVRRVLSVVMVVLLSYELPAGYGDVTGRLPERYR